MLHPGASGQPHPLLRVRAAAPEAEYGSGAWEEHLIPFVRSIVPRVDMAQGGWVGGRVAGWGGGRGGEEGQEGRVGAFCFMLLTPEAWRRGAERG